MRPFKEIANLTKREQRLISLRITNPTPSILKLFLKLIKEDYNSVILISVYTLVK